MEDINFCAVVVHFGFSFIKKEFERKSKSAWQYVNRVKY